MYISIYIYISSVPRSPQSESYKSMQLSWDFLCQSIDKLYKIVNVTGTFRWKNGFKNQRKIIEKLVLGVSGDLPGASLEPVGTLFETRRRFWKNLKRPRHVTEHIWRASWVQPGPQNRQNTDLWPKRRPRGASPEAFFTDLICRHRFRSIFCPTNVDFQIILDTFCDSQKYESRIQHTFFAQAANLENHCFLSVKH